jgi:hypothetical protein
MIPTPHQPIASGIQPPVSRGRAFCVHCRRTTSQTATRKLTTTGKLLATAAPLTVAAIYGHIALLDQPEDIGARVLSWALPPLAGVILLAIALRRHGYRVECHECHCTTSRLTPPRWSEDR